MLWFPLEKLNPGMLTAREKKNKTSGTSKSNSRSGSQNVSLESSRVRIQSNEIGDSSPRRELSKQNGTPRKKLSQKK